MTDSKKPPPPRRNTAELPASKDRDRRAERDDGIPPGTARMPPPSGRWEDEGGSTDLMVTAKLGTLAPSIPRPSRVPRSSEPPKRPVSDGIELLVVDEKQVAGG